MVVVDRKKIRVELIFEQCVDDDGMTIFDGK